jgi:hypothetical protein
MFSLESKRILMHLRQRTRCTASITESCRSKALARGARQLTIAMREFDNFIKSDVGSPLPIAEFSAGVDGKSITGYQKRIPNNCSLHY